MGVLSMLTLLVTHPVEFRTLVQYWMWHDQRDVSASWDYENTGWDRESMRKCWHFLDMTSRSFAAVIKQLEGDLARVVSSYFSLLGYTPLLNVTRGDRYACITLYCAVWTPSKTT